QVRIAARGEARVETGARAECPVLDVRDAAGAVQPLGERSGADVARYRRTHAQCVVDLPVEAAFPRDDGAAAFVVGPAPCEGRRETIEDGFLGDERDQKFREGLPHVVAAVEVRHGRELNRSRALAHAGANAPHDGRVEERRTRSEVAARIGVIYRELQDALFAVVHAEAGRDRAGPAFGEQAVERYLDDVL